ncbi:hypothetical protein V6N11_061082 [Hibiscus sabdariffa]|uniref:Leucine-rich repeat-containing N-terminal plant-type domain-containing protein n=1 Tax=Hibiscus sabdariffa TaxID=183260 RepID=A0ABR2QS46_9ROSI
MEFQWLWFIRIALIGVLLVLEGTLTNACLDHEKIALLQLKSFFNHYNELVDWDERKFTNCCEWKGIECDITSRRIIGLSLNSTSSIDRYRREELGEYWYLNASMFLPFVKLKSLSLQGNAIAGCIENEGFTKLSSTLNNLEILDLSGNHLDDSIMSSLSELSSLRYLSLADNQLKGSSHPNGFQWLSRFGNLETLDLSDNYLKNNSMFHVSGLSSLKTLRLGHNGLEGNLGHIQDQTQLRLTKLEELDLRGNLFSNNKFSFPKELSSLKYLIMDNNHLQGSLDIKDDATKLKLLTHLEELHLDYNLFNNSVFASLNWISNLKSLSISYNLLQGSLDMKDLDVFVNLRELDLSYNQLQDFVIHKGLGYLKKLEVLDLSENAFEGMLPHCLGNLTSLRELDISDNQFSGNLTPLANLTSLRFVSLSRNNFQIPKSLEPLANLPNLKFFSGDENKMVMEPSFHSVSVPKFQLKLISLSNCITSQELSLEFLIFLYHQYDLRYVDLSENNFSGTPPIWLLENNTELEYLFLRSNSFSGPLVLPSAPNFDLSLVDISDNKLQGQVPSNICSTFPYLRRLFLSENGIRGNIPSCLSGMNDLSVLDQSNNQLSASVPEELITNSSVSILRLSNNILSGNVVPVILKVNGLRRLYLDGNNFYGEMSSIGVSDFVFPTSLVEIDLSNNKLYGKLPRWVGNGSYLEILALSNNRFEGSIPMELCNLNWLEYLDLSQNNLSDTIPSCFNPPNIQHVHLHGNRLSGPLSLALYNSFSLVTLDLRGNNLSGGIPKWIDTLSFLSVLLLKANHLQGRIPV